MQSKKNPVILIFRIASIVKTYNKHSDSDKQLEDN